MAGQEPMKRKIVACIEDWYVSGDKHPLLVQGARRTGKTYIIDQLGEQLCGENYVKLDFQTDLAGVQRVFSGPTDDVDRIVSNISDYKHVDLRPETALIFLDEVQLDEKALNSLRFFSGSRWRVIASGSLLGITTKKRSLPFPSGVRQLTMHPLDFEEFLWALGQDHMAQAIREHFRCMQPYVLHADALALYRAYLTVGGMPLPVRTWRDTGSYDEVRTELAEIDATYTADMTDPDNGISGISAKRIWESLPKQLLRASTKKFKYADVVRGGRRQRLQEPLEWLASAGIVTVNDLTRATQAPLAPYEEEEGSFFKVYVADTGLMFNKFGIAPQLVTDEVTAQYLSADFRGALAENYVMQALAAHDLRTFYWMPEPGGARGEVDFLLQTRNAELVAVEVKSARNVSAKSMRRLMRASNAPYAIRLSEREFGCTVGEDGQELRSVPLYAAFCIGESEDWTKAR